MKLTERKWLIVSPQLLTANGTADGIVTVDDTSLFRVKQKVELVSLTQPRTEQDFLEIKRILSNTQMVVGEGKDINNKANLSAFLTTDIATIEGREQARPSIDSVNIERGVYEEEPVLAKRVILVDKYGNRYDQENPIPVDATVSVVVPPVTVDLDAFSATPDNVMTVGSIDGTKTGEKYGWVNNIKQQIMAAHDRKRDAFYLDIASKKDRRLDKFEYTSPTFPGVTLVRQFSWTFIGNEYVYEADEWLVV